MKQYARLLGGAAAGVCFAGMAHATTLNDVTLGELLTSADQLDAVADVDFFEAFDTFGDVFVSVEFDSLGDISPGTDDVLVLDLFGDDAIVGAAADTAFDAVNATFSILYDLSIETLSSGPNPFDFGVAIISFDDGLGATSFADLDFELVDVEIYGATVPAIPLPAGLPLFLAGIGAMGAMRMRQKSVARART